MGCMKPSKEYAMEEAEEAFRDIVSLLEQDYMVRLPNSLKASEDGCTRLIQPLESQWVEASINLKKAVQEMIWAQHCVDI